MDRDAMKHCCHAADCSCEISNQELYCARCTAKLSRSCRMQVLGVMAGRTHWLDVPRQDLAAAVEVANVELSRAANRELAKG